MAQNIRFNDDCSILYASKTVVEEGCLPHRIVLREKEGEMIVHTEILSVQSKGDTVYFYQDSFNNGNYGRYDKLGITWEQALEAAKKCFQERVSKL